MVASPLVGKAASPRGQVGTQELGTAGYRWSGGLVYDHSAKELRNGAQAAKHYQEMFDSLPVVQAGILIFQLLIRQASFRLEAADDSPEARQRKQFAEEAIADLDLDFATEVVPDALSMLVHGWSYLEETHKVRSGPKPPPVVPLGLSTGIVVPAPTDPAPSRHNDGLIGWRSFSLRAQRSLHRWYIDQHGRVHGLEQLDQNLPRGFATIPIDKALLFRLHHSGGNPEGRSLLASSFKSWVLLKRLLEREAIGLARDLTGIPMMHVPSEILASEPTPEDLATRTRVEQLLQGLTADEMAYVMLPSIMDQAGRHMWEFKLVGVEGAQRNFDAIGAAISRYEHRIATSMLIAFLLLGQERVGTQALAENNSDMLLLASNAVADSIAGTFTRVALPRLMRVNGWPEEQAPSMVPTKIQRAPTLNELGEYLKAVADIGVPLFPGPENSEGDPAAQKRAQDRTRTLTAQLLDRVGLVPPAEEL